MRIEFVKTRARRAALAACPWACASAKVKSGYMLFESINDYLIWSNQE